jgi:putative ABC transport system permease protein
MMRAHPLVRFALALCPADYRREYEQSIAADMRARGGSPFAIASDLCWQGIAMRFESLWRDLSFAIRTLAKSRMYTVVVISAIALAIACNAAVGSVLEGILLKPLPYPNADRLLYVSYDTASGEFSYLDSRDVRRQTSTLQRFAVRGDAHATLGGISSPAALDGSNVDEDYFGVLGAHPEIGRLFGSKDLGEKNVIISDRLWRKYFGASPAVMGRAIELNDTPYRIVGVMPPGFSDISPQGLTQGDFWVPLDPRGNVEKQRGYTNYDAWALLRPGVSIAAARADAMRVVGAIVRRYPATHGPWTGAQVMTALDLIVGPVRSMIWLNYAAAFILLVLACANVINLTIVRVAARERELVMRSALGASRRRIASQLIAEMSVLSLIGGAIGLALGWAALRLFDALGTLLMPRWQNVHVDIAVVGYICALLVLTSLITGIAPALMNRSDLAGGLKAAGRSGDLSGAKRTRVGIVILEIALALGLITAAGLTLRSFVTLTHVSLGFDARKVYAISFPSVPKKQYPTYDAQLAMTNRIVSALRAAPGIVDAASTTVIPFKGGFIVGTKIPGRPGSEEVDGNAVAPEYFRVMRIPLLRGRDFSAIDGPHGQSVAIVNAEFAKHFFGTLNVVGRRIKPGIASDNTPSETRTIVGVVGNTRNHFSEPMKPEFYLPDTQMETYGIIVARTNGRQFAFADAVKRVFASVAPSLAAPRIDSYESLFQQDAGRAQAAALLFGVLAAVALILALAGIYGVTAYSVTQRTQEFGVRKAIGARDAQVLHVVIADALQQAAIGIALGLVLAAACTRLLEPLLFQTSPFDPLTYAVVVVLIVACVACAALIPAIRATRVQPATALRYE